MKLFCICCLLACLAALFSSCRQKEKPVPAQLIQQMNLKRGTPITCGPAGQQLGTVAFKVTGNPKTNRDFDLGLKLLHSFEYDEAEKVFANLIDTEPQCAMAYWGVAMSNFHALWAPPSGAELRKGATAINIALSIKNKTEREARFIAATAQFYNEWPTKDHAARCAAFEKAMQKLYATYPQDKEAATFYALSLNAAADPADKSFAKQKKAGSILLSLYPGNPNHPGIVHYIIHSYDVPGLAVLGLPAARRYAAVAPSSAHALHMPSHVFTRLGLWNECIQSNLASVRSAQCYAQATGIKGHWDEELHGMDYLVYAYLQKGQNNLAKQQWSYLKTITTVEPFNFKVAYAMAAIPARYVLENKAWKEASLLQLDTVHFKWQNFAWQKAVLHFARLMGAVHTNNHLAATTALQTLHNLHQQLLAEKDSYKASQVAIYIAASEAWMQLQKGNKNEALKKMQQAADMEDKTEKHPVSPGAIIPARELLGDMLITLQDYGKALQAYETGLQKTPNRFNSLYGAGRAAEKRGDVVKAKYYYKALLRVTNGVVPTRTEIKKAKQFLKTPAV